MGTRLAEPLQVLHILLLTNSFRKIEPIVHQTLPEHTSLQVYCIHRKLEVPYWYLCDPHVEFQKFILEHHFTKLCKILPHQFFVIRAFTIHSSRVCTLHDQT